MSQLFKALSDPTRRRVLQLLRKGPMSAGELSDQFDFSKPTMSAHFAVLKEADLAPLDVSGYGTLEERLAEGHDIPEEERALMDRALAELFDAAPRSGADAPADATA